LQISERTQFKAIVVNQHNCISDTASAYYELIQIPSIPETIYFNQYHCKGNSTDSIVVFSFADNIQWYEDSIYYPIYEGNIFYPTINNEDDNIFIAVASNQSMCFSPPLEFNIQVVELSKSKIIGKNKVCEKTYKQIYTIDSIQKGDVINWNVSGNYLTTLSNTNKTIYIDFDNPGIDTLTLTTTSKDGCINIDTLVFKIAPKPEAYFTWSMPEYQQNVVFENQSIQDPIITTDTTIYPQLTSYWNYGREKDLFENLHSNQQFNRFDTIRFNHGKYEITLKVVNDYGCEDEIKNNIFIDIFSSLYIPNSFSPSSISEGIRTFTPKGMNLSKYEMYIYDAWGNLLFYTDKLSKDGRPIEGWDGTYQNEQMPSDIYFWKIEASFRNNSKWQGIENNGKYYKYGNLVLIR
jgi:gliding motility-associated-like protein